MKFCKLILRIKKSKFILYKLFLLVIITHFITGCSSLNYGEVPDHVMPITADHELNDSELLDVSIKLFDPGKLPEDEDDKRGLSEEIRNAEARFIPIHLKYTLQRSGYWGNVRVVPDDNEGSELLLKGRISHSDGESIGLNIEVFDATNKLWFERDYKETVSFDERKTTEAQKNDTFQNLYNKISNDIIEYRKKLTNKEIEQIKQVSEIRFANYMAPEIFSNYIKKDTNGKYQLLRLPSINDPMVKRVRTIKGRDDLLIDTINNYYDMYYSEMWDSYNNWREYRSEEIEVIREIDRKALTQKVIGVAAIIGAIALGASSNYEVRDRTGALRTVMIAGGSYSLYSGIKTSKESEINKEALEELGASFSTEVEPIVIDIKGKTMKLTGSADQQYAKWRNLLSEIYKNETGF